MLGLRWLPVRWLIRRAARSQGFLDPVLLLARLRRFTQPSEVGEPIELLRAGVVMHARGLVNARVLQHNLDWVWPWWVERQFDPADDAFVPRAFSLTHINLTHRNWTAVGLPDLDDLPIVDPRGLLTPFYDSWSLDCWLLADDGTHLLPSRALQASQWQELDAGLAIETETRAPGALLRTRVRVEVDAGRPVCRLLARGELDAGGWLAISLRPCNPEGVSFVHRARLSPERTAWQLEEHRTVGFSEPVARHHVSPYTQGDVFIHLDDAGDETHGECPVGMLTAAALFRVEPLQEKSVTASIPLGAAPPRHPPATPGANRFDWPSALSGHARLTLSAGKIAPLYDAALRTLVLHSPHDVWPGPFTYKRFWFRDAALIVHALLCAGLTDRGRRALDQFPQRQRSNGYFHSQDGEWDSNGQALWIFRRYCELTDSAPPDHWWHTIPRAARWIVRKRLSGARGVPSDAPHAGLLPAGFSAEHLGPNDFYYWDDFWGIAGLDAAAWMSARRGEAAAASAWRRESAAFRADVERSLAGAARRLGRAAMPASPYRRLDAGAIGSVAAGYPLQLFPPDDPRLTDTARYLLEECFYAGGFFQEMIHSGINAYLTLHVAQLLLRAGDVRAGDVRAGDPRAGSPGAIDLLDRVAELASPTGQWPEAIHPRTRGGCMGDGQHVWAAAEWVMLVRNAFVREAGEGEKADLVLAAGVVPDWLAGGKECGFGPAPTPFGAITVRVQEQGDGTRVSWSAGWFGPPPRITVQLPGHPPVVTEAGVSGVLIPAAAPDAAAEVPA
ncbi:MAG: hypothetical protein OEW11_11495 [Nitrospirota bacterium]|nr:hypothetical protein [Nitrospirota bacterium]